MDNGYTLCVLCCCSFGTGTRTSASACQQDLLNFFKVLVESPPQFTTDSPTGVSISNLQHILDRSGLSICSDCHAFIAVALETRSRAAQMEMNVRKLQIQILEQLRTLQSEMDLFHEEMTKLESVVKTSDESCLMFHMPRSAQVEKNHARENGVLVLRERILDVVTDLRIYNVSCNADARLPVDESEVEAMWEDAQQLVQCTPHISMDYDDHRNSQIVVENYNDSSGGGGDDSGGGNSIAPSSVETDEQLQMTMYMGHSVGTRFYVEGESEGYSETEDSMDGGGSDLKMVIRTSTLTSTGGGPTNHNFKDDVIRRALTREQSRTQEQNESPDPLRRYYLRFEELHNRLSVGSVEVIINEEDETLQCSQCSIMGKRSKSNHQSRQNWRDMEKGIVVHIIGKHLGGFPCLQCGDVFTSHTMIKKHVSKEHAGLTVSTVVSTPTPVETAPLPSNSVPPTAHCPQSRKPKPYACSMCPSAFSKPSELKRHFLAKHAKVEYGGLLTTILQSAPQTLTPQPDCSPKDAANNSSSSSPSKKKRKRSTINSAVSPASSEKVIPVKSALRPHECHICKYAFTKGSHLKRHMEVHRKRNELF